MFLKQHTIQHNNLNVKTASIHKGKARFSIKQHKGILDIDEVRYCNTDSIPIRIAKTRTTPTYADYYDSTACLLKNSAEHYLFSIIFFHNLSYFPSLHLFISFEYYYFISTFFTILLSIKVKVKSRSKSK